MKALYFGILQPAILTISLKFLSFIFRYTSHLLLLFDDKKNMHNTPGTRGWSRLRDRTLAVQKKHAKICFFSHKKIKITLKKIYSF